MASDRDLVADARAMTDRLRADDIDPRDRVVSAARNLLTALADEIERLRNEVNKLDVSCAAHRREYHDLHVSCEQRVMERNDARAQLDKVREHIDQRPEYVTACREAAPSADHDYYRWQGGAEARRQLAQKLGWTVPYEPGEKTGPKPTTEEARDE
ncbi:hypothetical protein [Nocardia ignorata]|uniref:Uncharacterized protein n=1 Tax=Nocardia ignorata TaxID=145285 RepID=A0A4R6P085_NOCIG|nr:hypothetical protein [Nocardia ignorata]TDP29795.1 hypothetical protein DFR75_11263 [Nocardia ignorata]